MWHFIKYIPVLWKYLKLIYSNHIVGIHLLALELIDRFLHEREVAVKHGTIIRTEMTWMKIPLFLNSLSLLNWAGLWSRTRLAISKKQKYFFLPDHQLAEKLLFACKSDSYDYFHIKISLKGFTNKSFAT